MSGSRPEEATKELAPRGQTRAGFAGAINFALGSAPIGGSDHPGARDPQRLPKARPFTRVGDRRAAYLWRPATFEIVRKAIRLKV